jgi:hypothetical protein
MNNKMDYKEINLYSISLSKLNFNENLDTFESKIIYHANDKYYEFLFTSSRLRLINKKKEDSLKIEVEFLKNYPKFYDTISSIDNYIINDIFKNGENILGSKLNLESIENLFVKTIKLPQNILSNPSLKLQLDDDCRVINKSGEEVDIDELTPNTEIVCILHLDKVLFYKNRCLLVLKVKEIKIENYSCQADNCLFSDSCDSSNDDFIENQEDIEISDNSECKDENNNSDKSKKLHIYQ